MSKKIFFLILLVNFGIYGMKRAKIKSIKLINTLQVKSLKDICVTKIIDSIVEHEKHNTASVIFNILTNLRDYFTDNKQNFKNIILDIIKSEQIPDNTKLNLAMLIINQCVNPDNIYNFYDLELCGQILSKLDLSKNNFDQEQLSNFDIYTNKLINNKENTSCFSLLNCYINLLNYYLFSKRENKIFDHELITFCNNILNKLNQKIINAHISIQNYIEFENIILALISQKANHLLSYLVCIIKPAKANITKKSTSKLIKRNFNCFAQKIFEQLIFIVKKVKNSDNSNTNNKAIQKLVKLCYLAFGKSIMSRILFLASKEQNLEIIKLILDSTKQKINFNLTFFGETALTCACINGRADIAELLIKNGAEVNLSNLRIHLPLSVTLTNIIKHLYSKDNIENKIIINNYINLIKLLIKHGADLNINRHSKYPLDFLTNFEIKELKLTPAKLNLIAKLIKLLADNGSNKCNSLSYLNTKIFLANPELMKIFYNLINQKEPKIKQETEHMLVAYLKNKSSYIKAFKKYLSFKDEVKLEDWAKFLIIYLKTNIYKPKCKVLRFLFDGFSRALNNNSDYLTKPIQFYLSDLNKKVTVDLSNYDLHFNDPKIFLGFILNIINISSNPVKRLKILKIILEKLPENIWCDEHFDLILNKIITNNEYFIFFKDRMLTRQNLIDRAKNPESDISCNKANGLISNKPLNSLKNIISIFFKYLNCDYSIRYSQPKLTLKQVKQKIEASMHDAIKNKLVITIKNLIDDFSNFEPFLKNISEFNSLLSGSLTLSKSLKTIIYKALIIYASKKFFDNLYKISALISVIDHVFKKNIEDSVFLNYIVTSPELFPYILGNTTSRKTLDQLYLYCLKNNLEKNLNIIRDLGIKFYINPSELKLYLT